MNPEPIETPATAELPAAVAEVLSRITPRTQAEIRAAQFRLDIAPRLRNLGFEDRFREELPSWTNAKQHQAYEVCERTLSEVGAVVALVGLRGTGKTTIAAQLAINRVRKWLDYHAIMPDERVGLSVPYGMPHYKKASHLAHQFKTLYATYGSLDGDELAELREYQCREWSLLVIDELHDNADQAAKDIVINDFVDLRYAARRDTLLISNQTVADFRAKTNPSILSRLAEHGCIIECNWRSWRERDAQRKAA